MGERMCGVPCTALGPGIRCRLWSVGLLKRFTA